MKKGHFAFMLGCDSLPRDPGRASRTNSPRFAVAEKLGQLWNRQPGDAPLLEDWLVDVANARGARIVTRNPAPARPCSPPTEAELSNAELVVGLLLPQNLDRPQILRLAAQLISADAVALDELKWLALQERAGGLLATLAVQALRVESGHVLWQGIAAAFPGQDAPREPLLHYTRLAEPVPVNGRVNAQSWRLVR
ncbi:hypothetical protein BH20VER3_BH20VER3_18730 [soil metagenome]